MSDTPEQIAVINDRADLRLTFAQSEPVTLSAHLLRAACKCAHCTRARIDNVFPETFESLSITDVVPQGHFGINIAFSDGHARGIYPWSYLRTITAS